MEPRPKELIPASQTEPRFAFSLIELLLVMAIIVLLSSMVITAVNGIMHGSSLTQAGDTVISTLNYARQTALASNHAIEVRFYQYSDGQMPGESANTAIKGSFRALQLFEYRDNGTVVAHGKVGKLPQTTIIDCNTTLSSLLTKTKNWGKNEKGDENPPPAIPRAGKNYKCCGFQFLPNGSTNLANSGPSVPQGGWFMTLHELKDGDNRTSPPANYITVRIDPVNGSLKVFRP